MIVSKKCVNSPEIGDKFTHIRLGSTWVVMAHYESTRAFFMAEEGGLGARITITAEGFYDIFRKFGQYNEKDLV